MDAAKKNEFKETSRLLKAGAHQTEHSEHDGEKTIRRNCLHWAIAHKNKPMLEHLLHYAYLSDLAFIDEKGKTPLESALDKQY